MAKKVLVVLMTLAILFAGVAAMPVKNIATASESSAEILFPKVNQSVPIWEDLQIMIHISDAFWTNWSYDIGYTFNGLTPYKADWKIGPYTVISFSIPAAILQKARQTLGNDVTLIVYSYDIHGFETGFHQTMKIHLVTDVVKIQKVKFDTTKIPWGTTLIQQSEWLTLNTVQSFLTTWKQLGKEDEVQTLWVTSAATGLSDTWEIRIGAGEPCVCFIVDVYKVIKVYDQKILVHISSAYPDTILSYLSDFQNSLEKTWDGKIKGMDNYSPESCFSLSWKVIH